MDRIKRSPVLTWLVSFALLGLCAGTMVTSNGHAQSERAAAQLERAQAGNESADPGDEDAMEGDKVSPDLREQMDSSGVRDGFGTMAAKEVVVRAIVQLNQQAGGGLNGLLNSNSVSEKGRFYNLNARMIEAPLSLVNQIASYKEVSYISLDRDVQLLGHVEKTTGADAMHQQSGNSGLNGTGIGIAILDSGLYNDHRSFRGNDGSRIVRNVDFTGEGLTTSDPYGHGTHVAGLAGGNGGNGIPNAYEGIASNAKLINLRVLNAQGRGTTSALLSALDWVMTNRAIYNIRVVNMSLGALSIDSYRNDPACRAVRRLVDAGIVVVAAAGNNGKNSLGEKLYGMIHSPGNEPSAITVGATNTYATDTRNDDTIATYSSRGPTRSYRTDTQGVKHYDNLIKPDLVAPGNKLVSAQAENNLLVTTHPELDATRTTDDERDMMFLSGTSMATPIVAGAAALLLQANPSLTPNMVKTILMYTAQPLAGFNMLEQGAGELNIEGAVRLAKLVRTNLTNSTPLGSPLLTSSTPPSAQSTIAGQTFSWGQGIVAGYTYVTGSNLIIQYQRIYGLGMLIGDSVVISNGMLVADATVISSGMLIGSNILTSNGMLIGDGMPFLGCGMLIGDGILIGDGMLIGDGVVQSDGMLIGDGMLLGDTISQSSGAIVGGEPGGIIEIVEP